MKEDAHEAAKPDPRVSHPRVRDDDARGTPKGAGVVVTPSGGRIGNPPFVPTDDQRVKVRALAKTFPPAARHYIAALMGFSINTLDRHFAEDMMLGRAEMLAAVGSQFINAAINSNHETAKGDRDNQKFILARMAGWSNKVEVTGAGGGPIETVDLTRLTPEQLEVYGRLSAIVAGVDPDGIIAVPR